jgi:hypothetical protein
VIKSRRLAHEPLNSRKEEVKMKKGILWAVVGLWAVMGLFACGGGGGGGGAESFTTPIGTTVDLSVIKNFAEAKTQGSTMSFNMSGSGSTGANLTGLFSLAISAPTSTVNVEVQQVTITNKGTGISASETTTYYYHQTGYLYEIVHGDGTISTPAPSSQTLLLSSAKVGDSGADLAVNNPDGSVETSTWRLDPGTNGDAKFVFSYTDRDSLNAVILTEEDSYTIKPNGSISALATKISYSNPVLIITLSGNKN